MPALRADRRRSVTFAFAVGRHQVFHCQVHAFQVPPFDVVVAGPQRTYGQHDGLALRAQHEAVVRTYGQHDGLVLRTQRFDRYVYAHFAVGDESRSFRTHLGEPMIEYGFLHLVFGDAVPQQAAESVVTLVHRDAVAGTGELLRSSQTRWTRTHHRDALARADRRRLGFDDALHPRVVGDGLLDAL